LEEAGRESTRGRRDFMAFYAFAIGTLREFRFALDELARELRAKNIFDADEWKGAESAPGLKKWQDWGGSAASIDLRDRLAFHVDSPMLDAGLTALIARVNETALHEGDTVKSRDSWFRLAHTALMEGASISFGDLGAMLDSPRTLLAPKDALDPAFLKALERCGLKPVLVKVRSGTPLRSIAEPLPAGTTLPTPSSP
jgi:hypothetical protein